MRLFIAIQFNQSIRDSLLSVQNELKKNGVRGNYTKPDNLHLTPAFIGEYSYPDRILEVIESVPFTEFPLRLDGIGSFGELWWIGIEKSDALAAYVRSLRHALSEADIPFDPKKFSPHITLIRKPEYGKRGMPGITVPQASMTVDHISLMRSDRGKNGMIYTELF